MRYRPFAAALLGAGMIFAASTAAEKGADEAKKKLQEVASDFIGQWNGSGDAKINGKKAIWKETLEFGWKFTKGGDAWIAVSVKDGKFFTKGDLKYDADKKQYVLTATDKDGKELKYAGKVVKGNLVLENKAGTDVHKLTMFTLADGARLTVKEEVQEGGKGPFSDVFKVIAQKEGESFAGGKKKNECVVTGGLGTRAVSFGGKTYYVCCSGCADEFALNPKKYVDEFEKKNK